MQTRSCHFLERFFVSLDELHLALIDTIPDFPDTEKSCHSYNGVMYITLKAAEKGTLADILARQRKSSSSS